MLLPAVRQPVDFKNSTTSRNEPSLPLLRTCIRHRERCVCSGASWGRVRSSRGYAEDRKSTRLNSSHANISYAVFCLKKKKSENAQANSYKLRTVAYQQQDDRLLQTIDKNTCKTHTDK